MTIRVRAWQGHEVVLLEQAVGLLDERADDVGKGDSSFNVLRQHKSSRISCRLETNARDPRPRKTELDDAAHLVQIDVRLQSSHECYSNAGVPEGLDCSKLDIQQRFTAQPGVDVVV